MVGKLNRLEVEKMLKSLKMTVFTPREFQDVFKLARKTALTFIGRNSKGGLFIKLRNGYYLVQDSNPSLYLIANKLYQPSYISLDKALAHYGIIPETVYGITSITTKSTQEFATERGIFTYQRIKQEVFTGYKALRLEGNVVLFAEPEKALIDYLYFVDLKLRELNDRLELRNINKAKLLRFAKLFKRPSLLKLIDRVYVESRKPRRIY
jgi:predicted transcriptional regulator of viral defense system